jgi:hypothetical protein
VYTFLTGLITGMLQIYKMLLPLKGGGLTRAKPGGCTSIDIYLTLAQILRLECFFRILITTHSSHAETDVYLPLPIPGMLKLTLSTTTHSEN